MNIIFVGNKRIYKRGENMSSVDDMFQDYMSFVDDIHHDFFDTMGMVDDDEYPEYDDGFLSERRQRPSTLGGVDWRYEKGGVFYND
jgi:hypothetical protein